MVSVPVNRFSIEMPKTRCKTNKPMWPMNAVSIKEAIGSAAKARMVGTEICIISRPSSSFFRTFLQPFNNMVASIL